MGVIYSVDAFQSLSEGFFISYVGNPTIIIDEDEPGFSPSVRDFLFLTFHLVKCYKLVWMWTFQSLSEGFFISYELPDSYFQTPQQVSVPQ